jgi:HlyD family secretion protein
MNDITRPHPRYGIWIVLAVLVAGGAFYWTKQAKKTEAVTLEKSAVTRGSLIESISSTGTLAALDQVTVGSQVSGNVTKVLVDYNDVVKKDQLLAVIDPQTLQAQVNSSKAALVRAQVNYDEAVRQYKDGVPLHEQKYLSDQDLRSLEVAVQTSKAQLDAAQIDFDKNNVQLKYAEIRSPIDGVIMTRSVDPGNTVQASMTAPTMFVVASDLSKMKILASVDETQIAQIKQGMKARFTVSGIANKTFNAKVRQVRLGSTTSNNVVTYTVVLDAENPEKLLFPGMTATIDFIQSSIEDALLVPSAALRVRVPEQLRADSDKRSGPPGEDGMMSGSGMSGAPQGMPQGAMPQGTMPQGGMPQGSLAQAGGMNGMPGGGNRNAVWMVNAQGKAYRVPVKVLGSDLASTAVEPMQADALKEGDEVVIRVKDSSISSSAKSSSSDNNRNMMMMQGPGGFGGGGGPPAGGGGGMGPG